MSSASPVGTRELSAELAQRGFPLVDAPVSGGVKKAIDGTLAIMVGGEPEPVARVRPLLEVMGKVFPTGASGSGHAMKSLNNFLSAANRAGEKRTGHAAGQAARPVGGTVSSLTTAPAPAAGRPGWR